MLLEDDAFPIVRVHYDKPGPGGLAESFAAFETQLARARPFVLIGRGAGERERDPEERRQVALWMKRHREALRHHVLALVYVEPDAIARADAQAGADAYAKFWGYPMLVTASDDAARAIAARLLAGEPMPDTHDRAAR